MEVEFEWGVVVVFLDPEGGKGDGRKKSVVSSLIGVRGGAGGGFSFGFVLEDRVWAVVFLEWEVLFQAEVRRFGCLRILGFVFMLPPSSQLSYHSSSISKSSTSTMLPPETLDLALILALIPEVAPRRVLGDSSLPLGA